MTEMRNIWPSFQSFWLKRISFLFSLQVKPGEMKWNEKTRNILDAVIIRVWVHLLTKTIQNILKSGIRDSPSIFNVFICKYNGFKVLSCSIRCKE